MFIVILAFLIGCLFAIVVLFVVAFVEVAIDREMRETTDAEKAERIVPNESQAR